MSRDVVMSFDVMPRHLTSSYHVICHSTSYHVTACNVMTCDVVQSDGVLVPHYMVINHMGPCQTTFKRSARVLLWHLATLQILSLQCIAISSKSPLCDMMTLMEGRDVTGYWVRSTSSFPHIPPCLEINTVA